MHIFGAKPRCTIGIVEFLRALTRGPLRTKARQHTADLVKVNAVATFVWTAPGSILDTAAGNSFSDDLSQLPNAKVFLGQSDIKDLVVNRFSRRLDRGESSRDDIANVHDGTPGSAIA